MIDYRLEGLTRRNVSLSVVRKAIWACFLAFLFVLGSNANASPRGDLKRDAKSEVKRLQAEGWPQSRCSLSSTIWKNVVLNSAGELVAGDKLKSVNGTDVTGMSTEEIIDVLKPIDANSVVTLRLERKGAERILDLQCEDSAHYQSAIIESLEFARKGKFDDCVQSLEPIRKKFESAANIAYRCASVSKNRELHDLTDLAYSDLLGQVNYARFDSSARIGVTQYLRSFRSLLPAKKFLELVELTTLWEGDETLFEDTEPNWFLYRENAERAVLSGFFDPSSAQFQWPYGFTYGTWRPPFQKSIEGYWTCGNVNGKNRFGGYVGSRAFVVVMGHNAEVLFYDVSSGEAFDFVSGGCQKSVQHLPPPPPDFWADARTPDTTETQPEPAPQVSVADELMKLAELFEAGAITQEEYEAAKARVLSAN